MSGKPQERQWLAWSLSACGSGYILVAIGTPFENLLAWHVARRPAHGGVLRHFVGQALPWRRRRGILFSGLRRRLLIAPLAGLPLLAYELIMHHSLPAPKLERQEKGHAAYYMDASLEFSSRII